jgi:hypothetical protein
MINTIMTRVSARMTGETYDSTVMAELAQTILDRLCLRLGVTESTFPTIMYSVAVDATVKAWRRRFFEGLSQEGTTGLTTSFVSDILREYEPEISDYLTSIEADPDASSSLRKVVRWI